MKPLAKQHLAYEKLFDNTTRFVGFGGGSGGGKSWLGAEWLLTNCYRYPGSKWFIGRNELTRLMASSYATFNKVCTFHDIPKTDWRLNGQYHFIEFVNGDAKGSRIDLLDLKYQPSDPMFQRFGSTEYTGGWIEEAGEVNFYAFDILKSRVGRWMNREYGLWPPKILLTFNPEQNWLYRVFYKPWKTETLPKEYAFIQALYGDNSFTVNEYNQQLDQISDPVLRARLKMGLWEYNVDENSLLDYDSIMDLFTNTIELNPQKYFTADVARYGSDKVTMGVWHGLNLNKVEWKQGRGIDQTASDVKIILQDNQIPYSHAVVDDDGVGGGVVDIVRGIKGFVGNSSAIRTKDPVNNQLLRKDNYKNLRSQCAFMLAEKIKNHELSITAKLDEQTKEMLIEELQQLKRKDTPVEAPLQIIPKDEIKEALGRSPDFADMMMMRMFFELDKPVIFKNQSDVGGVLPFYNIGFSPLDSQG